MKVLFIDGVESQFIADDFIVENGDYVGISGWQKTVYPAVAFGDCAVVEIKDYTTQPPVIETPVPDSVRNAQARLALLQSGLLERVIAEIEAMEEPNRGKAKIVWEYEQNIRRDNPLVLSLGALLGLNSKELDYLFVLAATL